MDHIASNNGLLKQFQINYGLKCLKCFVFSNMIEINFNDYRYIHFLLSKYNIRFSRSFIYIE